MVGGRKEKPKERKARAKPEDPCILERFYLIIMVAEIYCQEGSYVVLTTSGWQGTSR